MTSVIGFEGIWPTESVVAWGAAALHDGAVIWNSFSRHTTKASTLQQLPPSESYTSIEPISIRDEYKNASVVVVGIRSVSTFAHHFKVDTGKLGGFLQYKRSKGCLYYIFKDRSSFDGYVSEVISGLVFHLLKERIDHAVARELLTNALTLAPHSPHLHALRVIFSDFAVRPLQVARSCVRGERDIATFEAIVKACRPKPVDYWLKYQDGIAAGGGLDIDVAAKQFQALAAIDKKVKPYLVKRIPFLESEADVPSFRLRKFASRSADIAFGVDVEGEPLISRVARYMELQLFQDILRGNIPSELSSDPEFMSHVETLVHPTADTILLQRPLGDEEDEREDERVYFEDIFIEKDARPDTTLTLLGYTQGTAREVRAIEIKLFPGFREIVSLEKNGHGHPPLGTEIYRSRHDFLFRPAIFTLQKFVDTKGRSKFFLQSVHMVERDERHLLSAIPSTIVPGAFLLENDLEVHHADGGRIDVNDVELWPGHEQINVVTADKWMMRYAKWCKRRELERAEAFAATWVPPAKPKTPSAIMRVLIALDDHGGSHLIGDLIASLYETYGVAIRRNNTRREVRNNHELVTFDTDDDERVSITPLGRLHVRIHKAATGG